MLGNWQAQRLADFGFVWQPYDEGTAAKWAYSGDDPALLPRQMAGDETWLPDYGAATETILSSTPQSWIDAYQEEQRNAPYVPARGFGGWLEPGLDFAHRLVDRYGEAVAVAGIVVAGGYVAGGAAGLWGAGEGAVVAAGEGAVVVETGAGEMFGLTGFEGAVAAPELAVAEVFAPVMETGAFDMGLFTAADVGLAPVVEAGAFGLPEAIKLAETVKAVVSPVLAIGRALRGAVGGDSAAAGGRSSVTPQYAEPHAFFGPVPAGDDFVSDSVWTLGAVVGALSLFMVARG